MHDQKHFRSDRVLSYFQAEWKVVLAYMLTISVVQSARYIKRFYVRRFAAYEANLSAYERSAVRANIWSASLPPIYRIISMAALVSILYFGGRNVLGQGWTAWDIASFTNMIACFTRLAVKSSSAAKLFNLSINGHYIHLLSHLVTFLPVYHVHPGSASFIA